MKNHRFSNGIAISALLAAMAATSCSTWRMGSTRIELFNGKNLEGWGYVTEDGSVRMEDVWSVQDGLLTCKGTPLGAIFQGPVVTNFLMFVQYRWAPGTQPGNSGVFTRITEPITPLPSAIETQLQHGNAGDVLGLHGKRVARLQPRFFEIKNHPLAGDVAGVKKMADREKPPGEWNIIEVMARGPKYTVWMNREVINEVDGVEVVGGQVGLQSEGGVIQFRRAVLVPLD